MSCDVYQAFLLDEALPKPEGHDAHVAGCPECRALRAGHLAALGLAPLQPRRPTRLPLAEVRRRFSIATAVGLVLFGSAGLVVQRWLSAPSPAPAVVEFNPTLADPLELPVTDLQWPDEAMLADAEWGGLVDLRDALARDLSRDLREDELLQRSFGALPQWVAPTKTHPMRRLGAAAPPLSFTSEDSP